MIIFPITFIVHNQKSNWGPIGGPHGVNGGGGAWRLGPPWIRHCMYSIISSVLYKYSAFIWSDRFHTIFNFLYILFDFESSVLLCSFCLRKFCFHIYIFSSSICICSVRFQRSVCFDIFCLRKFCFNMFYSFSHVLSVFMFCPFSRFVVY